MHESGSKKEPVYPEPNTCVKYFYQYSVKRGLLNIKSEIGVIQGCKSNSKIATHRRCGGLLSLRANNKDHKGSLPKFLINNMHNDRDEDNRHLRWVLLHYQFHHLMVMTKAIL